MTKPTHTCFTIRERGEGQKAFWVAIGSAWTNKDGSLNLTLDALPVNGQITVRVRKERDAGPEQA